MALNKQPIAINFTQGLDTKSDPFQVSAGRFLSLSNSIFTTAGRLTKRNGYQNLKSLSNTSQTTLTTLNDTLVATGTDLYTYNAEVDSWLNKGLIQPVELATLPIVRSSTSQSAADMAVASSGTSCLVYKDNSVSYYQVVDSVTGQQIVGRTSLGSTSTLPRVFILGVYFIITFTQTVAGTPHLRYIAIPIMSPTNPGAVADISSNVSNISTTGYDGYVVNNTLYIAWGGSGSTVKITTLSSSLVVAAVVTLTSSVANLLTITADTVRQRIFVSYWSSSTNNGYTAAFDYSLNQVMAATQIINNVIITEITSLASAGVATIFYEVSNTYSYSAVVTDYISTLTCTLPVSGTGTGTASAASVLLRSVGLASKPFVDNGVTFMLVAYGDMAQSPSTNNSNQPTYFLIDSTGAVYMRLAYANGGGYASTQVLPTVSLLDGVYHVPYLITDFLATVNKGTSLPSGTPTSAIYTQTGINLAKFSLNVSKQYSSEIAGSLHLTGGQLWQYDGVKPVEHGFQVWPENIGVSGINTVGGLIAQTYYYVFTYEWTDNSGNLHRSAPSIPLAFTVNTAPANFTANRTSGSPTLASVSSFTNLQVGQAISGTGIPANTYILSMNTGSSTITMSANASSGTATSTTVTPTTLSSVTLNIPTLRLTFKNSVNPVRIVGYRWSTAQQVYYQFTSITSPTVNDTTVDSVAITDSASDASILGQTLLYTTGGVIENIAAPASIDSALFDNRLFLIDAEDRNLLWYSKQVIENTPVEMSDLFTIFVAPTSGAQGSTGPMTAISSMDDKLIVFKENAIYYINGSGPDNAGLQSGYSSPIFITAAVGCNNPASVVLTPNGLMFQSNKGIWLLGRDLSTKYIGDAVEQYNAQTVVSAKVIPNTTFILFVLDNSITLMYDYYYSQWGTHSNISAISSTIFGGVHTYLNSYGQVLKENPGSYTDGSIPVLMSLTTSWINIAGLQGYERFYFANLLGTYYTPFKLNVSIAYNYNSSATQNIIVSPDNYSKPWGDEAQWGSGPQWGGGPGNVFSARLFPETQKCQSFQLVIQEIYDPSLGAAAGQGLSLSGLALIVGMKKGYRTQSARRSFG